MHKNIPYHTSLLIILILLGGACAINPFKIPTLKSTCILGCITAGGYMLYNDYQFVVTSYNAIETERALNQLLNDLATNLNKKSPDPQWCVSQHQRIKQLKETAAQYQHKAFITKFLYFLMYKCKRSNHLQQANA